MKLIKEFLLACWIILIPFQDSGLQGLPISFLGGSPSFIPGAMLILLVFTEWLTGKTGYRFNRNLIYIIGYVVVINALYLILFGTESHGTNLIVKSFNLAVLTGLLIFPIFFFSYDSPRLGNYTKAALIICLAGVLLGDLLKLDVFVNVPFLHYHENLNMRPRGFALESSTLSAQAITLSLLTMHLAGKTRTKAMVFILAVATLIYCASRGGLVVSLLTGGVITMASRDIPGWRKILLIGVMTMVVIMSIGFVQRSIGEDVEAYTSTSTRAGLVVTSVNSTIHNPFGVGFAGFLPAVDKYAPGAITFLDYLTGGILNFAELESYIRSDTDINISTKTFLFDNLMYYGLPFLIMFVNFHRRLLKKLAEARKVYLAAGVLFSLIAVSTYIGGLGMYNLSLLYGVAYSEIRGQENFGGSA